MCGINGFNFQDRGLLRAMSQATAHRGPDDTAFFETRSVSLNQNRLSIIDLKKGIYPLTNEAGDIVVVFNGEIYNFKALRSELMQKGHRFATDCDGEVIAHAYEEYGVECVKRFNGMFAFALYDARKKKLFLARDRTGIKPLYYWKKKNQFVFSSEIKGILEHGMTRKVNSNALRSFVQMRYVRGPETMFEEVNRLQAGTWLLYDLKENKIEMQQYWDAPLHDAPLKGTGSYFSKTLHDLLKSSVQMRLVSDVPLGLFLSGGVDSSAMLGLMHTIRKETGDTAAIKTFTIGFEEGGAFNETNYARQAAENFETDHHEFLLTPDDTKVLPEIAWHLDEPMADPALLPLFVLAKHAKEHVTVALTGDGGDELFAGYDQYKFMAYREKLQKTPQFVQRSAKFFVKNMPTRLLNRAYKYAEALGESGLERFEHFLDAPTDAEAYHRMVSVFSEEETGRVLARKLGALSGQFPTGPEPVARRTQYFEFKTQLQDSFLMKTDRMTMAAGMEARVPLLDHRITELAFRMPLKYQRRYGTGKWVLKQAIKREVPAAWLKRKKQTFHVPIDAWLDSSLREWTDAWLDPKVLKKQKVFDPAEVQKIREKFDRGKLYYARQLWNLVSFQAWWRVFMDEKKL